MQNFIKTSFLGNSVLDYLIALGIIILLILAIWIIKRIVFSKLKSLAKKTTNETDDFLVSILDKTFLPLLYYGAFYIGLRGLSLTPAISKSIRLIGVILLTVLTINFTVAIIKFSIQKYWLKDDSDPARKGNIKILMSIIKTILWGTGIFFLLDNLGFKISSIIAGLGIGGIAVALAVQNIFSDLFSYLAILLDKPFEIGDFIIINDYMGTIEHIGIKTTRIRSLSGEQIVFSNSDLTGSRVRNYKRMNQRRVVFTVGVTYDTTQEQLKQIPGIIEKAIKSIDKTRFDRAHFASFGDFSLNIETVYYVLDSDYNIYMDIQQKINLEIMAEFEKLGIEFAFPTQTIYLDKTQN